jgi:hypothetical protein
MNKYSKNAELKLWKNSDKHLSEITQIKTEKPILSV